VACAEKTPGGVAELWARIHAHGVRAALREDGIAVSYGELAASAAHANAVLDAAQVCGGAVILLQAEFGVLPIARMLAILRRPAVAVVVPPSSDSDEQAREVCATWIWRGADLTRMTGAPVQHPLLAQLRLRNAAGLVFFSSGASGGPKAVLHDADCLLAPLSREGVRAPYRLISTMPMAHIGGFDALARCLFAGACLLVPARRDPNAVVDATHPDDPCVLVTTPSFLNLLRITRADFEHVGRRFRMVAYGAEPMPDALLAKLRHLWPNTEFRPRFGTSETGALVVHRRSATTAQFAIDPASAEYRVVDGELWLRNSGRMLGYLNSADSGLHQDGWFATGDFVEQSADGFLRVIGRRTALINVGGNKVHPEEVESALWHVPGVVALRARGEAHAIMGQAVSLDVVAEPATAPAELRTRIRVAALERLPAFKRPAAIRFVPGLQTTASGKVVRA
jgi:acyl-CoA synthetase (AMP-forming)/AMP-acid ligase II